MTSFDPQRRLLIGAAVIFLRLYAESRAALLIFAVMAALLLLVRERLFQIILRQQLRTGQLRQPVALIGLPDDIENAFNAILNIIILCN